MRVLLVLGFAIAVAATVLVVVADSLRLLRLAVVLALWAALIGAFAVSRARRDSKAAAMRVREAELAYQLELNREVTARREFEADLASTMSQSQSEQIDELRAQLERLTDVLASLADGELTVSRLTLSAESARFRAHHQVSARSRTAVTAGSRDGDRREADRLEADGFEADRFATDDEPIDAEIVEDRLAELEDEDLQDDAAQQGTRAAATDPDEARAAVDRGPVEEVVDRAEDSAAPAQATPDATEETAEPAQATGDPAEEPHRPAEATPDPVADDAPLGAADDRPAPAGTIPFVARPQAAPAPASTGSHSTEEVPAAVWAEQHVARLRERFDRGPAAPDARHSAPVWERPVEKPASRSDPVGADTAQAPAPDEPATAAPAAAATDHEASSVPRQSRHGSHEPDEDSGSTTRDEDVSVADLLAAYGLSGQPRRRRRG